MLDTTLYEPPVKIIDNYANVLVNFALNSGDGVKPGEVVQLMVPDVAKSFALALRNTVLRAGAHPMLRLLPTGFDKDFFELANEEQLKFFPKKFSKARVDLVDHTVGVVADPFPEELQAVDPKKIILARDSAKKYRDWFNEKEVKGKYTWTVGLWGVEAKAKIVGLTLKEYWQQIIKACFLDEVDPVQKWLQISKMQTAIKQKLNAMKISALHIEGQDADIVVGLGESRQWVAGGGRNIPSFEIFTSPDWRDINGWIKFNQPVYRYGNKIEDTYFEVKNGLVVKAKSRFGNKILQEMIKSPNANKFGEVSLTDKRMSKITHIMAEILYDENIGGPAGNTHLAIGMAYKDCFAGNASKLKKRDWQKLGFNDSAEHTDFISTTPRQVTAILSGGSKKVIYKNGQFVV